MDRKPKFRSRKLEYNRPLQVYRYDEAVDIDDYDNPMRAVPLIATGVDKEEEEEHHLQVALTAAQVTPKDQSYMIPTPEAAVQISDYDRLYPSVFKQRKGFIRHTGTIEDLSFMQSKYIADSEDIKFLQCKSLHEPSDKLVIFEHVLECFENAANKFSEGIVSVDSSLEKIRNDTKLNAILMKETTEALLESWLQYWKQKRKLNACSLVPGLKFEDVGKIGSDPYVCFRRRELKQPRKTRRSDAQVMEKIRKIHYDLDSMKTMLAAGIKRDKFKKESFVVENAAFEKYWILRTWQQEYGIERPPTLPSFKAFHQQVPYFPRPEDSKKKSSGISSSHDAKKKNRPTKKVESSSDFDSEAENELNEVSLADLVKISIPPMAIKSVQYSRPYYPFEVVKQIQKDVEALLTLPESDSLYRDFTADLGSIERASENLIRDSQERFTAFRRNYSEKQEMIKNRHLRDEKVLVLRLGRCGRVLQSETTKSSYGCAPVLDQQAFSFKDRFCFPGASNHLRSIQARDCAHLNNAFVGNYNQHYIQCTANLSKPTSLPSWIAATSGLVQGNGGGGGGGSNKKSSNSNNSGGSPSKKKRPAGQSEENSSNEDESAKKTKTASLAISTEATISSLTASPQFTVKVKSKMDPSTSASAFPGANFNSSSSSSSGIDESDDGEGLLSKKSSSSANAARFTPTGLQKESRLD